VPAVFLCTFVCVDFLRFFCLFLSYVIILSCEKEAFFNIGQTSLENKKELNKTEIEIRKQLIEHGNLMSLISTESEQAKCK